MNFSYFYSPSLNQALPAYSVGQLMGQDPNTMDLAVLNIRGWYPVNLVTPQYDANLYVATPSYVISGSYADQQWAFTPVDLGAAKATGSTEAKAQANAAIENLCATCGFSNEILTAVSSQDPLDRPARYQEELDEMVAISTSLDSNLTAIDAATSVDEINNIVNKPTGILFTGRGSGLGPEDLNVSYYNAFNSVSMTEAETELYIPSTDTVIAYGSGGPNAFDSMGNAFNPGGPYTMQIRETATSMVIAEIEVPLNAAGEDVAF